MKIFGSIILAAIVSALLGGVVTVALPTLVACAQVGCALSGTQQLALMPFYAGLGALVFAAVALRKRWQEPLFYAVRLLLLIPVVLIVVGFAAGASPNAQMKFEFGNALLLSIPFWVVIVSQWWMVRRAFISREVVRS